MKWNYVKTGLILAGVNLVLCAVLELLKEFPFAGRGPFIGAVTSVFLIVPIMALADLISGLRAWLRERRNRQAPASPMQEVFPPLSRN